MDTVNMGAVSGRRGQPSSSGDGQDSSGYGRFLGLLVVVMLVAVALLLIRGLKQASQAGDCLRQGRSDCNILITSPEKP